MKKILITLFGCAGVLFAFAPSIMAQSKDFYCPTISQIKFEAPTDCYKWEIHNKERKKIWGYCYNMVVSSPNLDFYGQIFSMINQTPTLITLKSVDTMLSSFHNNVIDCTYFSNDINDDQPFIFAYATGYENCTVNGGRQAECNNPSDCPVKCAADNT